MNCDQFEHHKNSAQHIQIQNSNCMIPHSPTLHNQQALRDFHIMCLPFLSSTTLLSSKSFTLKLVHHEQESNPPTNHQYRLVLKNELRESKSNLENLIDLTNNCQQKMSPSSPLQQRIDNSTWHKTSNFKELYIKITHTLCSITFPSEDDIY